MDTPLTQQQLLSSLRQNWEGLLTGLLVLDGSNRLAAAQAQSFASTSEFLGHVCAWFEELLWAVPKRIRREPVAYSWQTVDEFNARAMARYRERAEAEVVQEFRALLGRVEALVASLTDEDLAVPHVYEWIHNAAVGHPLEHCLSRADRPEQEPPA